MQATRMRQWMWASASMLAAMTVQASYIDHHFDGAPFTLGTTFTNVVQGWQSPTVSVVVVNTKSYSASQSVYLPAGGAISNAVVQSGPSVVWTDLRIAPYLGAEPDSVLTNGLSALSYFGTDGRLRIRNGNAWLVCSNDVFNQPLSLLTNGVFMTLSIYQNFTSQKAAILINDRLVAQDLPFPGTASIYNYLSVRNSDSNAWLDDAYVQTNYDATRLTSNLNGIDGVDASELQTFGYAARTLTIGNGPYAYSNLTSALAVARDRDRLSIDCGMSLSETATITQNLMIVGCTFTNAGTITVASGKSVTISNGFTSGLNVIGNLSLAQGPVVSSSLTVSGTLTLAQGVVVSGATVAVTGLITVPTNNAQLLAGDLNITGGGLVVATGGQVADAGAGVDLTGTFTLTSSWDTSAVAALDFIDDFELYAADTRLQALGYRGWGASTSGVMVKATQGYASSKGVILPSGSLISNRLSAALQTKIWTDFQLKPAIGAQPTAPDTNAPAFLSFVGSNGYLNVWSAGAWVSCTNYSGGSSVPAMTSNAYTRVTVFANFTSDRAAVFVDGKLARELVGFPAGGAIPGYSSFRTFNSDAVAYLDSLHITTNAPVDLTDDQDGDELVDAQEIESYDSLLVRSNPRTVFRFR